MMGRAWIRSDDILPLHSGVDPVAAGAIADELVALTGLLSNLAFDLGSDPDTLRKHMGSMQAIDLITQVQLALADILRSDAPIAARIDAVTVEALGRRLTARMAGLPCPVEVDEADPLLD